MEPALRLSWKERSRLGKPQVYGPGSDNSHDRVVKTAPKVRWQWWQKRFITEDSLSAKDAMFLITLPGRYHRLIPALRGEPTRREGCPESHSQKEVEPERECTQLGSGCWVPPAPFRMEVKPTAQWGKAGETLSYGRDSLFWMAYFKETKYTENGIGMVKSRKTISPEMTKTSECGQQHEKRRQGEGGLAFFRCLIKFV